MKFNEDNFKVLGYMVLHYGSETLAQAIESVLPWCDHFLIVYTPSPSFGHDAREPLPASERMQNLKDIVLEVEKRSGKPFTWLRVNAYREGTHREYAHDYAKKKGYDVSICVDSDEVWTSGVQKSLLEAYHGNFHEYRTNHEGWRHFYRNNNEFCTDGFQPVRLFNYNNYAKNQGQVKLNKIDHYGYSVSEELMKYKLSCHGHRSELRQGFYDFWLNYDKKEWDRDLYKLKRGEDWTLHPVSKDVWFNTQKCERPF